MYLIIYVVALLRCNCDWVVRWIKTLWESCCSSVDGFKECEYVRWNGSVYINCNLSKYKNQYPLKFILPLNLKLGNIIHTVCSHALFIFLPLPFLPPPPFKCYLPIVLKLTLSLCNSGWHWKQLTSMSANRHCES